MVEELELAEHDVSFIAELIDDLIMKLLPRWNPSFDYFSSGGISLNVGSPTFADGQTLNPWDSGLSSVHVGLVTEQDVVSGSNTAATQEVLVAANGGFLCNDTQNNHNFQGDYNSSPSLADLEYQYSLGSGASEVAVEDSSIKNDNFLDSESSKTLSWSISEPELRDTYFDSCKLQKTTDSSVGDGIVINNSTIPAFTGSPNAISMTSSCSSLSLADKDIDSELKMELDAIDAQYQYWFQELSRRKLEALESAKKKWMAKKKLAVD